MAFGGVATGSMKAQVAAKATGMVSSRTLISPSVVRPTPTATPPMMGMKVAAVAVLEVISVRKRTRAATAATMSTMGRELSPLAISPIHRDKPEELKAEDKERPPPKRRRTSHGISLAVFQSSRRMRRSESAGRMNKRIPAAMPTMASS